MLSQTGKYKLVDMETGQEYIGQKPGMGEKLCTGRRLNERWKDFDKFYNKIVSDIITN